MSYQMDIEELRKDLTELRDIRSKATRKRVQDALSLVEKKMETEIYNLGEKIKAEQSKTPNDVSSSSSKPPSEKKYVVDLNEYAWDQSDKFVKIFVTLDSVQNLTEADVQTVFTSNSLVLTAKNLNNRDYRLVINNLLNTVNIEKSYHKIKTDMVAIYMKKQTEAEKWSHLTITEKRLNDLKDSKLDLGDPEVAKGDPTAGIMGLMKRMYETGDPEMKRMIAKAWTESKDKQTSELPM